MEVQALLQELGVIVRRADEREHEATQIIAASAKGHDALASALVELAAAVADREGHWVRFPEARSAWEDQSKECRNDWHRICRRHDAAVRTFERLAAIYVRRSEAA